MDSNGKWLWVKKVETNTSSSAEYQGSSLDAKGNIYITGHFTGTVEFGTTKLTSTGRYPAHRRDIFVAKFDSTGKVIWATSGGGDSDDYALGGVVVDANGNVFIAGMHSASTFGTIKLPGRDDVFVAKLDKNGKWLWAKEAGASTEDCRAQGIALDTNGNVYITGFYNTYRTNQVATFGTFKLKSSGLYGRSDGVFVAKLDTSGKWLWVSVGRSSTRFGNVVGYDIKVDSKGDVLVVGSYAGTTDFGGIKISLPSGGSQSMFFAKLDKTGKFTSVKTNAGSASLRAAKMTLDTKGYYYIAGDIYGSPFSLGSAKLSSTNTKGNHGFVSKNLPQ